MRSAIHEALVLAMSRVHYRHLDVKRIRILMKRRWRSLVIHRRVDSDINRIEVTQVFNLLPVMRRFPSQPSFLENVTSS
jgi:hypothetical protein